MSRPKTPRITEEQLVAQIQTALTLLGYVVLRCGQHRADAAGNTEGIPDLFVANPRRPGVWLGAEIKTSDGSLSNAQRDLHAAGLTVVVRSVEEAARAAVKALVWGNDCRPDWALKGDDE